MCNEAVAIALEICEDDEQRRRLDAWLSDPDGEEARRAAERIRARAESEDQQARDRARVVTELAAIGEVG